MDQPRALRVAGVEPATLEILDRTRSLTGDQPVSLTSTDAEAMR